MGSCPGGELSKWGVVLAGKFSSWGVVPVRNCPSGELSWWGIVQVGSCPRTISIKDSAFYVYLLASLLLMKNNY